MSNDAQEWAKRADEVHARAQISGLPEDYLLAAELYELAGLDQKALQCREAAERARWSMQ